MQEEEASIEEIANGVLSALLEIAEDSVGMGNDIRDIKDLLFGQLETEESPSLFSLLASIDGSLKQIANSRQETGNVSSGIDSWDAKNPSESHNFAVYTTFDPASGSDVVFGQVATGKVPVNPSELCDLKDVRESAPISAEPKYPIGSFVKWGQSKYEVKGHNPKGYWLEATEGTFRDSWSSVIEKVLSPWEELGNPPSRVPLAEKPVEVVCVLDEESYEGIYVDGKFQDHGLFEIGEIIGKKTCTIESLRVVLGGEDWPDTFDPSWRELKPETEYREPTQADLANGPIECEVMDEDNFWVKRQLFAVACKTEKPFIARDKGQRVFYAWKHCRIKTVSPTDSQ